MGSNPRHHHYVPIFYLKNFSNTQHSKDSKNKISVLSLSDNKIFNSNIRDIGAKQDFYSIKKHGKAIDTKTIEGLCTSEEHKAIALLKKLIFSCREDGNINALILRDAEIEILSKYLSFQYFRTFTFRNSIKESIKEFDYELEIIRDQSKIKYKRAEEASQSVHKNKTKIEKNGIEELLNKRESEIYGDTEFYFNASDSSFKTQILEIFKEGGIRDKFTNLFLESIFHIEINKSNIPFVTSDNPVILLQERKLVNGIKKAYAFEYGKFILYFAISPDIMLVVTGADYREAINHKVYRKRIKTILDPSTINKYNKYNISQTGTNYIYTNPSDRDILTDLTQWNKNKNKTIGSIKEK